MNNSNDSVHGVLEVTLNEVVNLAHNIGFEPYDTVSETLTRLSETSWLLAVGSKF